MRLTIVPEDRCIFKNGASLNFDFVAPSDIIAIQWYGEYGTIERKSGIEHFTDPAVVQPYADAYDAERARLDAPPPAPPPPTQDQIIAGFTKAMEAHYDTVAKIKHYDSRFTCALRAGYAGPFQAEGTAFAVWMDTCNAYGYAQVAAVLSGQRSMPTIEALVAELPAAPW